MYYIATCCTFCTKYVHVLWQHCVVLMYMLQLMCIQHADERYNSFDLQPFEVCAFTLRYSACGWRANKVLLTNKVTIDFITTLAILCRSIVNPFKTSNGYGLKFIYGLKAVAEIPSSICHHRLYAKQYLILLLDKIPGQNSTLILDNIPGSI